MTPPAPPEGASAADRAGRSRPAPAMDEQATPGLFSGSGGGSLRAPQAPAEAARAQYHVPGILHFLRHEWARFEVERAQWEVERAELQVGAHTASIIGQPEVSGGGGGGGAGGVSIGAVLLTSGPLTSGLLTSGSARASSLVRGGLR